ncbi:hypothetical protein CRYUN_Cryun09bG0103800 [Craigia yunnanensis]
MDMRKFHSLSSALMFIHCFMLSYAMFERNLITDQQALLEFKHRIVDPHNILTNNWTTTSPVCNWIGVSCTAKHRRVRVLNLPNMSLTGIVPPHIGNLSFLISLNLSNNNFHGNLPKELGQLNRLKHIELSFNFLSGEIPTWFGRLDKVLYLNLRNNNLTGTIPRSIVNMSNLEILDLNYNLIHGYIPNEISNFLNLKILRLAFNQLSGSIPSAIYNISSLHMISLPSNNLYGSLPQDICRHLPNLDTLYLYTNEFSGQTPSSINECRNLQDLELSSNRFSGNIPKTIGNLTRLQFLYLGDNDLEGEIPREIRNLQNLEILSAADMKLVGPIPASIFNISSLKEIDFSENNLSESLPQDICRHLPNLEMLYLYSNEFSGQIPSSIDKCRNLQDLSLSFNRFSDSIPRTIGNLTTLQFLFLGNNHLEGKIPYISSPYNLEGIWVGGNNLHGNIPDSISNASKLIELLLSDNSFSDLVPNGECSFFSSLANGRQLTLLELSFNPLNCILPTSISNVSTSIQKLYLNGCKIRGSIPLEIGSLNNVMSLDFSVNELSGSIPATIGRLKNLQFLNLYGNKLQGSIPHDLCGLKGLYELSLGANELDGPLPTCLGDLISLRNLNLSFNKLHSTLPLTFWSLKYILKVDLSSNYLRGSLPLDIGNLKVLVYLNLSRNLLSSDIPFTIGSLLDLQVLILSSNRLQGPIPESLGDLMSLTSLDLSNNNFSGVIPKSLERLSYLNYFDVSFNKLEGEIPSGGPFVNFTTKSFLKNYALCGPPKLQVRPCKNNIHQSNKPLLHVLRYVLPTIASIIVVVAFIVVYKKRQHNSAILAIEEDFIAQEKWRRISYYQLLQGTDGFSENNLLGSGSFGSVYKGMLSDGPNVAIKVFNLQTDGSFKSFDIECEVMSNILHRNLVKVITCCSTIDFKALVLEFMPNGSLEKWLYSSSHFLDIQQRINIMIDVASALEYLHLGHPNPIVHCDLKPSNVLLDNDMVAHVGDFGLAKLLGEEDSIKQTMTFATIGYMAPEYGSTGIISVKSDVYSYGILLMEVFTRKKPTDEIFSEEMSMKHWMKRSLPNGIIGIVDSSLVHEDDEYFVIKAYCMSSIMGLALDCLAESPDDRMDMKNVVSMLKNIKRVFEQHST